MFIYALNWNYFTVMKLLYTDKEFGYALMQVSYSDWLQFNEPLVFSWLDDPDENNLLALKHADSLTAYSRMVAVLKVDDTLYKLTGKNRKEAWLAGKNPPPESLIALVIDLSEVDFAALNAEAQNTQIDALPSNEAVKLAYQELGLAFHSDRLKGGFIIDALNIALRGKPRAMQDKRFAGEKEAINLPKAIHIFSEELKFIDSLQPKPEIFVSGVLAGAILMLGINRDVKDFFTRLNEGQGEIRDGLEDPVAGLLRAIEAHRTSDPAIPAQMAADLCRKTIQATILWGEGADSPKYWRKKLLSGLDPRPYIRELKSLKQINEYRDL